MSYARRTDGNHAAVLKAIREVLGWQCMSLHAQGKGCEDILVAVPGGSWHSNHWVMLEVKVPEQRVGKGVIYFRYTPAQKIWRERTEGWPRITAISPLDAVDQLRHWVP